MVLDLADPLVSRFPARYNAGAVNGVEPQAENAGVWELELVDQPWLQRVMATLNATGQELYLMKGPAHVIADAKNCPAAIIQN